MSAMTAAPRGSRQRQEYSSRQLWLLDGLQQLPCSPQSIGMRKYSSRQVINLVLAAPCVSCSMKPTLTPGC